MKHTKIALLIALLATSGVASADFFDGFENGNAVGQGANQGQANTAGQGQGYGRLPRLRAAQANNALRLRS